MKSKPARGRWAPSPTGLLHVGSARTALVAWLVARSEGGSFIWRTEDLDAPRTVRGMAEAALQDLAWLGLDWDEGPDVGGPFGPYDQSARFDLYDRALLALLEADRLFPCSLSRADIRDIASAPSDAPSAYPLSLRPDSLDPGWYHRLPDEAAIRFMVEPGTVSFVDRVYGVVEQDVAQHCGDFVVMRRDGCYAYQLAVTVDDILMDVNQVVRGADLLDSTPRQIQLLKALGAAVPDYAHVPLVLGADGRKLSKRHDGITIRSLRAAGWTAKSVCGYLAYSLGLESTSAPIKPHELLKDFGWDRIRPEPWILEDNFPQGVAHV